MPNPLKRPAIPEPDIAHRPCAEPSLRMSIGAASSVGRRERNEDFHGLVTPEGADLETKGVLLAVADGVSGHAGGREAAEYLVRGLLADYYATPETWSVPVALDKVIGAANGWLLSHAARHRDLSGMASTLSALVLRGSRYYVAHVGDSRIYRLSRGEWTQLTEDHVWDRPDMQHVLKRAVGLDRHLAVDYVDGELLGGDRFVVCSDGVWAPLDSSGMLAVMHGHATAQAAADALVEAALRAGGKDNATAIVADVETVPAQGWRDWLDSALRLPVPPRMRPGQAIDDYDVLELLHESRATLLYRVRARQSGRMLVLKTLQPALADDRGSCEGLLAEEWLSKRIVSPCFPQVIPMPASARHHLYYVMTFHAGSSLQQQLDRGRHFTVAEIVAIGIQTAKGLGSLHRLGILHRDVKPSNLLQGDDGALRILDLGVALAAGVPYPELEGTPGTPSFMAPELFSGQPSSVRADLYALGVTLYHLLTRKYPHGEVEPFQTPRFGDPIAPTRHRPDIPQWLENALLRAVARDGAQRFETAEAFLLALEHGDRNALSAPMRTPLLHDAASRWQAVALILLVVDLLLLYLLLIR